MIDLREVITKYPESLESATRFRAYMADLYPERADQARIKVLADVISCGIVDEIKAGNTDNLSITRYRKLMEDRYGYSGRLVAESIAKWVQAYAPHEAPTEHRPDSTTPAPKTSANEKMHVHRFEDIIVPPTCQERGYTLHRCKCGYEHRDKFIPVGDHHYDVVDETAPTCTEEGRRDYLCSVCSKCKSETIPKTAHRFSAWKTVQKAGCGVEGRKERHCATCAKTEAETIPALQHDWTDWTDSVFATCTESGKRMRQCKRCKEMEEETTLAIGHSFSQWKDSATHEGMMERFCENCGEIEYKETISKLRTEQQALENEIADRKAYLGTLGLFKRKEKEAIKDQISALKAKHWKVTWAIREEERKERLEKFPVGSIVQFGTYLQGKSKSDGKTPIEWQVLECNGNTALLLSKYALDYVEFVGGKDLHDYPNWETSYGGIKPSMYIQNWLNGDFLYSAFNYDFDERKVFLSSNSVFLLDNEEVSRYFKGEAEECFPTEYAKYGVDHKTFGLNIKSGGKCEWGLRSGNGWSVQKYKEDAIGVIVGGRTYSWAYCTRFGGYIRPAMRINLCDIPY